MTDIAQDFESLSERDSRGVASDGRGDRASAEAIRLTPDPARSESDLAEVERLVKKVAKWERADAKQVERQAFVDLHGLRCFKCKSGLNEWASTGTTNGRSWALCVMCNRENWQRKTRTVNA